MAVAEEKVEKVDIFEYQCNVAESIDDITERMQAWRKRGKGHEAGDWVMACPEPLKKGQAEQRFCWIVHPDRPGKGGPEVACRAAWVALMYGRCFDVQGDFKKKSEHREAALAQEPLEFPVLTFPNKKTSLQKPMEDSDDEDEVPEYFGTPVVFAVRYKENIYTGDTLTDKSSLNTKIRMTWSGLKDPLLKAFGHQAKFHRKQMDETVLTNGKQEFLDLAKKNKANLQ